MSISFKDTKKREILFKTHWSDTCYVYMTLNYQAKFIFNENIIYKNRRIDYIEYCKI